LAYYQVQVSGVLDPRWSEYIGGMEIMSNVGTDNKVMTTLSGELIDQAALLGVLNHLYNLGLPLLLVECRETNSGSAQ
jgi:hypothetical protein